MRRLVARAARRYGVRPSALLGMRNEWLALAFDLGMIDVSERETQRNMKRVERSAGGKGMGFPVIDIYRAAADRGFSTAILGNPASRERIEEIIRVQRVPSTEAQGRIHTSTATVSVLPEAATLSISFCAATTRRRRSSKRSRAAWPV